MWSLYVQWFQWGSCGSYLPLSPREYKSYSSPLLRICLSLYNSGCFIYQIKTSQLQDSDTLKIYFQIKNHSTTEKLSINSEWIHSFTWHVGLPTSSEYTAVWKFQSFSSKSFYHPAAFYLNALWCGKLPLHSQPKWQWTQSPPCSSVLLITSFLSEAIRIRTLFGCRDVETLS